ncbi:MAG TPA: hypothetical protein VL986_07325 [Terracidiphilus sp.]|nr:hypothetical protein [Terracidiphilus sp.]
MTRIMISKIGGRFVALLAIALLVLEPAVPLGAQEAAPPKSLQIVILDDEAPLNNISERTAREPIVQVQDENHKPVAAASVLFAIHPGAGGAGAGFANGASTLSVTTNANGVARASGLVMNQSKGTWQLQVTASKNGLTTSTTINETNITPDTTPGNTSPTTKPPVHLLGGHGLAIIGGIAVIGAIVSVVIISQTSNSATHIGTGGGTVGAPTVHGAGFKIHF